MKSHRNAKTNVYQRELLIERVRRQGWTQRQAAEAAGISVRTVAKWLTRGAQLAAGGAGHMAYGYGVSTTGLQLTLDLHLRGTDPVHDVEVDLEDLVARQSGRNA